MRRLPSRPRIAAFAVLPDLTDQDLKEIGASLGHRRQLLREIANLGKTAPPGLVRSLAGGFPACAPAVAPGRGARRHVTAM
jgi:SAM domain (Sterile alpha motif)